MELSAENLKKILSESSSVGTRALEFNNEDSLVDQGIDSLDTLDYLLKIEEVYDVEIPDSDVDKVTTINDIIAYIKSKS